MISAHHVVATTDAATAVADVTITAEDTADLATKEVIVTEVIATTVAAEEEEAIAIVESETIVSAMTIPTVAAALIGTLPVHEMVQETAQETVQGMVQEMVPEMVHHAMAHHVRIGTLLQAAAAEMIVAITVVLGGMIVVLEPPMALAAMLHLHANLMPVAAAEASTTAVMTAITPETERPY